MSTGLHILPAVSPDIRFERAGEKRLLFLIPEKCRIESMDFSVYGKPLSLDIGPAENSSLANFDPAPDPSGKIQADALTIDFHQPRTIHTIDITIAPSADVLKLACILRVWGGNQWYLPLPVNLLKFTPQRPGGDFISMKLPALKAEKLLLNFVKLKNIQAGSYLKLSDYPVDDLMEIMNFEATKAVEEAASVTVNSLALGTADSISSLTMGLEGKPPLFISPGDFTATEENPQEIPDPGEAFRRAVDDTPPLEINELDIPESLKAELPDGKKYHPVSLTVSSATSGILTLHRLSAESLFHENVLAPGENIPPQALQTLRFLPDSQRKYISEQPLFALIPHPSKIKKIGFTLSGSLLNEVRTPEEQIEPLPFGDNGNMGIRAAAGEKLFSFFSADIEAFSLKAVEIPGTLQAEKLELTLSVLNDADAKPDLESKPLSITTISYEADKKDPINWDEKQWFHFDFPEPFPVIPKNTPHWLCLETTRGNFTWQAETAVPGTAVFVYRMNESGTLIPCGPHLGKPVILTARFIYRPDDTKGHLVIMAGDEEAGEAPLTNLSRIESDFAASADIVHSQGTFPIRFISKSEGFIDVSNADVSYEDSSNPIYMILDDEAAKGGIGTKEDIPFRRLMLNAPVEIIDGIGKRNTEYLSRIGVRTVSDLAALEGRDIADLSEKTGISPERLGEFISRALAVKSAIPQNFPNFPVDHHAEFEAIRRMSADDIAKTLDVDPSEAVKIKESVAILHGVTDASVSCL